MENLAQLAKIESRLAMTKGGLRNRVKSITGALARRSAITNPTKQATEIEKRITTCGEDQPKARLRPSVSKQPAMHAASVNAPRKSKRCSFFGGRKLVNLTAPNQA